MVVGLAGGIASGKSTVARMFGELGAVVIDADAIARSVLEAPTVREKLRERWGADVFQDDGRPDPSRIADVVFSDSEELAALNRLVHPPTGEEIQARIERASGNAEVRLIVVDAPLLFETELQTCCDAVLFVAADEHARLSRAGASRNWTREEVTRRESAQMPPQAKERLAGATIDNNGSPEETRSQVERLFRQWTQEARPQNTQASNSGGKENGQA